MVATKNIDTLGLIWTFSLRGVLTFVASGLDINGCVWSYFEGTTNVHYYTSCILTTLHCSKVSFLQCCRMKKYNKIFTQMWGVYSLLWDTVCVYIYIYIHIYTHTYIFIYIDIQTHTHYVSRQKRVKMYKECMKRNSLFQSYIFHSLADLLFLVQILTLSLFSVLC